MLRRLLILMLVLLMGCIDPVDVDMASQRKHLVVEAYFTDVAQLNYVRLSYSQPHSVPYNEFEKNATVTITGSGGELYTFYYDQAGYYYPHAAADAVGQAGTTYTLNIQANGKTYRSAPVTMRQALPIEGIHFEVDHQSYAFYGERVKRLHPGYKVMVDYQDPAGEKNYLRWSFATQYEVSTQPWEYKDPNTGLPKPKDCCTQCFLEEKLEMLKVADDRLTDGKKVKNFGVLFIPFEKYLGVKNKLTVYQHSISSEAYEFFRILEQQKNSTGTVFDPPPAEVKGNIVNIQDEAEQVIGFFDVSGVSVKEVTILLRDIDYPVATYTFHDDCRLLRGATTTKPEGW